MTRGGTLAIAAILTTGAMAATPSDAAAGSMAVAEQNVLVQHYCAVCHTDATPSGRLSLEKFDAASLDPDLAAMLVSKLKGAAIGASGAPRPDKATENALIAALSEKALGANRWTVKWTRDSATLARTVTASMVQEVASAAKGPEPDLYRLILTCNPETHKGDMQLAWSPADVPQPGGKFSVSVDGKATSGYTAFGGDGAAILYASGLHLGMPALTAALPSKTLTIGDLAGVPAVFSFADLDPAARRTLSACFDGQ